MSQIQSEPHVLVSLQSPQSHITAGEHAIEAHHFNVERNCSWASTCLPLSPGYFTLLGTFQSQEHYVSAEGKVYGGRLGRESPRVSCLSIFMAQLYNCTCYKL